MYDLDIAYGTLDDQLALLAHAESIGLPVTYVELGNEFYLDGAVSKFATVEDYGIKASEWASEITSQHPGARVGVVGWDRNKIFTATERQSTWNSRLRPFIEANPHITSLTVHPYTFINYLQRLHGEILDLSPANIQRLLAMAADASTDIMEVIADDLPAGTSVWATEYNLVDLKYKVATARWIHGVWTSAAAMQLAQVPGLDVALVHSWSGPMTFAANHSPVYAENFFNEYGVNMVPWGLTACGVGISDVYRTLDGAERIATIDFDGADQITTTVAGTTRVYSSLIGIKTASRSGDKACIANLSDQPVTVNLHRYGLPPNGRWQQHTSAPSTVVADATTDVTTTEGPVSAHVELAPYSVTTVAGPENGHGPGPGVGHGHGQ